MTDTEILDAIERYGIQLWPDLVKLSAADTARINAWMTFCRDSRSPGDPVQAKRACLRATLVDTIEQLENKR